MTRIKLFIIVFVVLLCSCSAEEVTLSITIPKMENIQNINTNYYKLWLEEQTGYTLVFNEVAGAYDRDYIIKTLSDNNTKTDLIFFGTDESTLIDSADAVQMTKYFLPLDSYVKDGTNYHRLLKEHEGDGWSEFLKSKDDKLYFAPTVNPSRGAENGQSLWINTAWLTTLGSSIPTTTEELEKVLTEFKIGDANGNGIADEIPLAGSMENYDTMSYNAIINSYIYYDAESYGFYTEGDRLMFSPTDDEFRKALIYLNSIYEKGLLHSLQFRLDDRGLAALATDPVDILGAFSASHLSDVFTEDDSNRFSHFTQIAPLKGEVQHSVPQLTVPVPAAAISANTEHPDEAFKLLDLMYSEDAFLIALYGEEGVDWEYAKSTDVDIYGEAAEVATINHVNGIMQNKNLDGLGVMYHYPKYADGVRYTDYNIGYFNARALLANEPYFKSSGIGLSILKLMQNDTVSVIEFNELNDYTQQHISEFITGVIDVNDDKKWDNFVAGYEQFDEVFRIIENEVLK